MAPKRHSQPKVVYFALDRVRGGLMLVSGCTKTEALTTYLTEYCKLSGSDLKTALATELNPDTAFIELVPAMPRIAQAKHRVVSVSGL